VPFIVIGGVQYTQAVGQAIMSLPKHGDSRLILFFQLAAAKLNFAAGTPSGCVQATITAADLFFMNNHLAPPYGNGLPFGQVKSDAANALGDILNSYNNDNSSPCGTPLCPNTPGKN
jgi:hypothetical protein